MVADADLQVWLDTQSQTGQTVVVPYVKSAQDAQVSYRMDVIKRGKSGFSRVSQHGTVKAAAAAPTALSRLALGVQTEDECHIELVLRDGDHALGTYRFDCPR